MSQRFHGASPLDHSAFIAWTSLKVSMHCQKPPWTKSAIWPSFASGLVQKSKRWQFEPETIAGARVASPVQMVFVFNGWGREPPEVPEALAWGMSADSAQRYGFSAVLADKGRGPVAGLMVGVMSSGDYMPSPRMVRQRCGERP